MGLSYEPGNDKIIVFAPWMSGILFKLKRVEVVWILRLGFDIPSIEDQSKIVNETRDLPDGTALVPSLSDSSTKYSVDMPVCECFVGRNENVCKHMYMLWASGKYKSFNFVPYLRWEERKTYTDIAIGSSLTDEQYHGIHEYIMSTLCASSDQKIRVRS